MAAEPTWWRERPVAPAYTKFLAEHGIADVHAVRAFAELPLVTKDNYLRRFPLPELCRNGDLAALDIIAFSSGSTGAPTVWPRSVDDEVRFGARFEDIFVHNFCARERSTLAVVLFPFGNWVGGHATLAALRLLKSSKGCKITCGVPGNQPDEIFRVLTALAPLFKQTVLLGYPPFVKQVIDQGLAEGVPWARYNVKCVFAGEVFSELWRDLVLQRLGGSTRAADVVAIYGTADAGVLANETPLSIQIRRLFASKPDLCRSFFGESRLPTLVQYDPEATYFEVHPDDHTLILSVNSGVPLVRYHIADNGGVVSYDDMLSLAKEHGLSMEIDPSAPKHPFVYLFGRTAFTVSFFGAKVYPENVSVALEDPSIAPYATGKFVMQVRDDHDSNRYLSLVVELGPSHAISDELRAHIATTTLATLRRLNSEFANYAPPACQLPVVELRAFRDAEYFPAGVKHRYTRPSA